MKFPYDSQTPSTAASFSASGALAADGTRLFVPRLPSTWPSVGPDPDSSFADILERLFVEGMLAELKNVSDDIRANSTTGLQGRGHVVGVAIVPDPRLRISVCLSDRASAGQNPSLRTQLFRRGIPSDWARLERPLPQWIGPRMVYARGCVSTGQ